MVFLSALGSETKMFSEGHIIFIIISCIMIAAGSVICRKLKPPADKFIKTCFFIGLALEVFRMLLSIEIVPVVEPIVENGMFSYRETGKYTAYLRTEDIPFELCSLQVLFMFLATVVKDRQRRKHIYSVIYGTALIGGTIAIALPYLAPGFASASAFLSSPLAWEFFIYHSLIITVAIYIGTDRECGIRFADCKWVLITLAVLDLASFYMNSIASVPVYQDDHLTGVEYAVNYFSSYNDPLGIPMPEKWQYLIYLAVRILLAFVLVPIVYLPFLIRERKEIE